jgi:hypothetical protein
MKDRLRPTKRPHIGLKLVDQELSQGGGQGSDN